MDFGQVHHIEYYVDDLAVSNKFWSWFLVDLGYKKSSEWNQGVSWSHKNGTYLVFVQVEKEYLKFGNSRQGSGLNHIAFMGGTIDQLDLVEEKLKSHQIKILKRDGSYLCFEDPNSFAVELYARE